MIVPPTPDQTQIECAEELTKRHRCGLSNPIGSGKTLTALLSAMTRSGKILVLAPGLSAAITWDKEILKWYPNEAFILIKNGKELEEFSIKKCECSIIVMSLNLFYMHTNVTRLWYKHIGCTIIDEAHRIPLRRSLGFKQLKSVLANPQWATLPMILITSSTMRNKTAEVWRFYSLFYPTIFTSYYTWADKMLQTKIIYVNSGGARAEIKSHDNSPIDMEAFQKQYQRFFVERSIKIDHPEPIFHSIEIPMVGAQKRIYNQFINDKWLPLTKEGDYLYNVNVLTEFLRLNVLGVSPSALGVEFKGHTSKETWLVDWLDSHEDTVLIGSSSAVALKELKAKGIVDDIIIGEVSKQRAREIANDFDKKQNGVRVLGITYKLAESITLIENNLMVCLDYWATPEEYRQFIGRSVRRGQERVVQIFNLIASPLDNYLFAALTSKDQVSSEIRSREHLQFTDFRA